MTVKDLIEKLSACPPDIRVLVEGYEGGLADILRITTTQVAFNRNQEEWLGAHEEDPQSKDTAVAIFRT